MFSVTWDRTLMGGIGSPRSALQSYQAEVVERRFYYYVPRVNLGVTNRKPSKEYL